MLRLILTFALILGSCAHGAMKGHESPDLSMITPVSGRDTDAHVCPVSPTLAFTAYHVAMRTHPFTDVSTPRVMVFVGKDGKQGSAVFKMADARKDVAVVEAYGAECPGWYDVADEIPKQGSSVWIKGYDVAAGLAPEPIKARVLQPNVAGQMRYSRSPGPGSSGSCVLNADDEIVAVNVSAYVYVDAGMPKVIGSGWLMADDWYKVPRNWAEEAE